MNQFIAIHYNGQTPAFTYTNTLEDAKRHLSNLIANRQVGPNDAMAIVRAEDDQILYFKMDNNTMADLSTARAKQTGWFTDVYRFFNECSLRLRHSIVTPGK
ncbi:hypothetical protein BN8_04152 [Fibrisoma limi BUZ 3]|uniref:Uncharacterized protein n=1 Tax=Fibrisoma limi BUZ 3 TaxID=1185876 RepID=I2GM05_9BACT|nr:hypothetical protein [Fibrisoma limi]CCH54931.1 hypothetical protein BN8_04152 [Fibrisoma limi BUZ 3]